MKKHLFYTFLILFVVTFIVTILGVINIVPIDSFYLKGLFGSLLIEMVGAVIGLFKATNFFTPEKPEGPYVSVKTGNFKNYKWVRATKGYIPEGAYPAGREEDGSVLYIARAELNGGIHPGKIGKHLKGANIPFGGKEVIVEEYEVLVYDKQGNSIKLEKPTKKLEKLPASDVTVGVYSSNNLSVDIKASVKLNENVKPAVGNFIDRLIIRDPYCSKCLRPLEELTTSWIADNEQIGYECKKCNVNYEGDIYNLKRDVKGCVRNNYDKCWENYQKEISKLTGGHPEKYTIVEK